MYGCESCTVKKAEHWRIDAFELWCWRRLLRVPCTARRSNQSILKEISPGCSLEGLMLKLKLQYFGHLMWRADSLKKTDAGKDWGREEKGMSEDEMVGWHHRLNGHEFGWTLGVGDGQGGLACCGSWGRKESDTTERLNWTEAILWETQTTVQSKASKDTDSIVTFLRILKHIKNILVFSLCKRWFSPHPARTYLVSDNSPLCCKDFCLPFASCRQSLWA